MAWSIFDQPNGEVVAVEWAVLMLMALGAPTSAENIQFVYQWEKSEGGGGAYNPLNQGPVPGQPSWTTTGQQYGGGAADFTNWQTGIQGAVAYLNMPNFAAVKEQLIAGNAQGAKEALWNSPWAASHYGYGHNWFSGGVPQVTPEQMNQAGQAVGMTTIPANQLGQLGVGASQNAGAPNTPTGAGETPSLQTTDASGNQIPSPPGMNDIPALVDYIKQYFGADAWLLNVSPQVAQIIEQAVAQGRGNDGQYIQTLLEGTTWFKTTSKAYQQYLQQSAANPADYQFNVAGSLAARTLSDVRAAAATQGVQIADTTAQALAMNFLKFGWDTQQLNAAIGDLVYVNPQAGGQGFVTNAGGVVQQLQAAAGQYLQKPSDSVLASWAANIAAGTQTMQQFDAQMKQDASLKWTGMAGQIAQGYTPQQIVSRLQSTAAQTMEVDPSQIDFVNNPFYAQILDYAPPGEPGKPAPGHRLMTDSEMQQYLKSSNQYSVTAGARNSVGQLVNQITTTFGKAP